MLLWLFLKS
uniref:Uncharacterized protein n=1 Tax=Anguilla anguilla TaxID=7936 RepID=A0A0E9Q6S3_ANGAN